MLSKNLVIDRNGDIHPQYKLNKVLTLISVTLLTLMIMFTYKLISNLMSPILSPLNNEINTILSSCLAVNIAACLILYKYQLVVKELEGRAEIKKAQAKGASKNIKIEIEERKRLELDLQRSEEKYTLLLSLVPAIAFKGYTDFTVDFSDNQIEQLTGYKEHDFKSGNTKWSDLIIEEDLTEAKRQFIEALSNGNRYVREYRIINREGEVIWIHERAKIFRDKEGRVEYVRGVLLDINILKPKQAEEGRSRLAAIV